MEYTKEYLEMINESNALRAAAMASLLAVSPMADEVSAKPTTSIEQPSSEYSKKEYSKQEKHNIIARTLYAEARNDGELGMTAVASIIYNRGYGNVDKMIRAIRAPKQFSCWNGMTNADWTNFKLKEKSDQEWDIAKNIATKIINGQFSPTHNYDHYFNPDKASPSWGYTNKQKTQLKPHKKIGSHVFMKLGAWVRG